MIPEEEVERVRPRALLLVDELRGEPLTSRQWHALVAEMRGSALEGVRIAHVKPFGLSEVEHCEIFAVELGFQARVFVDERAAELWLRYGEAQNAP